MRPLGPAFSVASVASSRCCVSAGPAPGKTSIATTRCASSGAAWKALTSSGSRVTCSASPPVTGMRQTCEDPDRLERNQTDRPSAAQRGSESPASWEVRRLSPTPSEPTSHRSVRRRSCSKSVRLSTKTTSRPSGETRGSETRSIASRSWTENGWGAVAGAAIAASGVPSIHSKRTARNMETSK